MTELFSIEVDLTQTHVLQSPRGRAAMVLFTGRCRCDFFQGDVLPGGVDTQLHLTGKSAALSARYMLEGTDNTGRPARIFIENNGVFDENGVCTTRPRILTDSPALAFLETASLRGSITGREGGVTIHFFTED